MSTLQHDGITRRGFLASTGAAAGGLMVGFHVPLAQASEAALPSLLPRLARTGTHLMGVHPSELVAALRGDPELGPRVTGLEPARPWAWWPPPG